MLNEKEKTTIELTKMPLVIRRATLMSEGLWNNVYYGKDQIFKAFKETDWNSREKRNLFLDHKDYEAGEWLGEVDNMFFKQDTLYGDLIVHDPIWASKLKYGKPKMGISPKVNGKIDGEDNSMQAFTFENFSLVINPAVKTAYINNMEEMRLGEDSNEVILREEVTENAEVTAREAKRKQMGLTPAQFYAIPRTPPSESKLPIFDKAHVQNAMARFNQITGVSPAERATAKGKIISAANKFGIKVDAFKKLNTEEEVTSMEDMADLFELWELKGLKVTDVLRKAKELKEEGEDDRTAARRAAKLLEEEAKTEEETKPEEEKPVEEEKPAEPEPPAEEGAGEADNKKLKEQIKEMSEKIQALENEPAKSEVKKAKKIEELSSDELDQGLMDFLKEEVRSGVL